MKIQWYPGHMTKAKRKMESDVKLVDMVIELVDARAPLATRNPDIKRIAKGKQILILMNKSDLADEKVTRSWIEYFKAEGAAAVALDGRKRDSIDQVRKASARLLSAKRERDKSRGITGERAIKTMICGIPNVGKSTFINSMLGKASAKTGNKPGVTKGNQWININDELLMLDTPGVLWPRFDDEHTAECLAFIGSINDDIVNQEELANELLYFLYNNYRENVFNRYQISSEEFEKALSEIEDGILGVKKEPLALLNLISVKRGCLKKGAQYDYAKTAKLVIDDFRSSRLGRISLERP